jgi:peptide/nickel transport system substrate-binding protein
MPIIVLAVALLLAPTSSVGAPMSSWDAKACGRVGGTLVFAEAGDPDGLDPHEVTDGFSVNNTTNVFDTLVRFTADGTQVEPSLAESWTVSSDNLVWTFNLRKGVKFHDGTPFNAGAVKFSYDRQTDPKHAYHPRAVGYADFTFQNVKSVDVVDDLTVRWTLSAPYAPFITNMAMFSTGIASPTAVKKYGKDFFKNPVGTGPFKLVEWVQQDHVTYEANRDYWAGRPCVDRLIIRTIPDNTVRLLEMERGTVHLMDQVNPPDYNRIRNNPDLVLFTGPGLNTGYISMNTEVAPFSDRRVRQAVNYAVDRNALINAFYGGVATPAKNPLPSTIWGYNDKVQPYEHSVDKAKKLLAEAGFANGLSTELYWPNRARPYLTQPQKIAEAVQQQLAQAGIKAQLVTFEWGTYLAKLRNGEDPMAIIGWIGDNGDPDNFLYALLDKDNAVRGKAQNYAFYKSDAVHRLLIQAQQVSSQAARAKLYEQAQEIIHRDAPWAPLVHASRVAAYRKDVQNYFPHPLEIRWLHRVWLSK